MVKIIEYFSIERTSILQQKNFFIKEQQNLEQSIIFKAIRCEDDHVVNNFS